MPELAQLYLACGAASLLILFVVFIVIAVRGYVLDRRSKRGSGDR